MMSKYITRSQVIEKACHDMLKEMYMRAQPPANIDDYINLYKKGILDKDKDRCYEWHYLPEPVITQIIDDYIEAYGANDHAKEEFEWLIDLFKNGGYKTVYEDLWNEGKKVRSCAKTEKLGTLIGNESAEKVYSLINNFLHFYKTNREESIIRSTIFQAPTSNPETVIKKWGSDVVIDDSAYKGYDNESWDYTYKDYYDGEITNKEVFEEDTEL